MLEWSRAFGGIPIFVHEADRRWVPRPETSSSGTATREILPGRTLINAGVHFAGGTVLHWPVAPTGAARCAAATSSRS